MYVENSNISFDLEQEFIIGPTKKYKNCLGKLCFKGELQTGSFLVEFIFILLSHLSQGGSLVTFEMDYMLLF